MRNDRTVSALTILLLLTLAGTAMAGESTRGTRPHHQARDRVERQHERGHGDDWNAHGHGHGDWQRARRDRDGHGHENHGYHDRDRGADHRSWQGRGYWRDYHYGHHYDYRHRYYNNYHYYYNTSGFYFPGYGFIERGHVHGRYCPHWHFEDFAAGFVLGAIIFD
ncbi:MAG TPA: hypothetical protein VFX02_04140 [Gammaproteobacteria bacterium]|nr:hypothetical protein [Gammaproteobacteria bacterium]